MTSDFLHPSNANVYGKEKRNKTLLYVTNIF